MDDATKADRFLNLFRDMALAYNRELDLPQVLSYWAVLKDVDLLYLSQAALHLRQMSTFFPAAADWYKAAKSRELEAMPDLPKASTAFVCETCRDSGFVSRVDDGGVRYASPCGCRATNPVLKAERDRLTKLKGVV